MSSINGSVNLTLRPLVSEKVTNLLKVTVEIENANYEKGELFDAMAFSLAACKCEEYNSSTLTASDDNGEVPILFEKGVGQFGPQNEYKFNREVHGNLKVTYTASVPKHDPYARNPGFSLARHDYGITGAGLAFLLLPSGEFDYSLNFDLSELGSDAMAIMGSHRGNIKGKFNADFFKNTYFAIGNLNEYSKEGSRLHIFTLDKDNYLFDELAKTEQTYYDYISEFFNDTSDAYHIILYPTRRTTLTGTALPGICYLGFGNDRVKSVSEVENTLAHELTHNWSFVDGEESMTSLFAEGTAEYYSCYMQYHTGQTDLDGYVEEINKKLRGCYCHPFAREESFAELYEKSWTHSFCQKIPYIKGILMCMKLDSLIRRKTSGEKSFDDICKAVADAANNGNTMSFDEFKALTNSITEGEAEDIFAEALEKGIPVPDSDFFGEDYELVCEETPTNCEGFDPTVRFSDNIIRGLISGSNAEKAGLKNGDKIIQMIADDSDISMPVEITVQRGCETLRVSYLAQGEKAPCWQYRKKNR